MPSLVVTRSPGNALPVDHRFSLNGDQFVLGREQETCNIHIPNQTVSKRHAQISRDNGTYLIEDLKSRNHTFVNNEEVVAPRALKHRDRIRICDFQFEFFDEKVAEKIPIPKDFGNDDHEGEEDQKNDKATFDYEHSFDRVQANQFLDSQPAEQLRALLDISSTLAKTLELEPLLPQITETLFSVFRQADRCFIFICNESGKAVPIFKKLRRPAKGEDDMRHSNTIVNRCLDSMTAYLTQDASADAAMGAAQSIADFRIRSVMCVPLADSEGKKLGAIQLDTQERTRKFREEDLKLLTIVGNFASIAVEKARFHQAVLAQQRQENEIRIAQEVQLGLLPKVLPDVYGYEFYAAYSPAKMIGGDYYDFIRLKDGRWAVCLGDVSGKGIPAALLMAKLSAEVRACVRTFSKPCETICELNEELIRSGIGDRFVTFALVLIDPERHTISLVNAGHLNPLLYSAATDQFTEAITNQQSGVPLGIMSGFPYEAVDFEFAPGDALLLFTDGVTDAEAPNDAMFGMTGLTKAISGNMAVGNNRPKSIGDRLMKAVRSHASGRPQFDDIAVACVGRVDDMSALQQPGSGATATAPVAAAHS
jgi:sigma-B regulation protein RsbU (phosphoserine phosphatase)